MSYNEWKELKHGDRIRFIGAWNPKHIGEENTIYVDREGNQYLEEDDSLYPLYQFSNDDYEKVERN